jgi:hypothetical protein
VASKGNDREQDRGHAANDNRVIAVVVALGLDLTFHRTAADAAAYYGAAELARRRVLTPEGDGEELAELLRSWLAANDFLRESTVNWTLDDLIAAAIDFRGLV